MKHIVAFSGGLASAVVANIVVQEYNIMPILLFHDTKTEPKDNYRQESNNAARLRDGIF